jgi:hypothetical protein
MLTGDPCESDFAEDDSWGEQEVSSVAKNALPLKLDHLGLGSVPLRGLQSQVDLGAITALSLDVCDGLPSFLSHWHMSKPINLRTLRLRPIEQVEEDDEMASSFGEISSFMRSFSGLVEFVIDCPEYEMERHLNWYKISEVMLANHFKTLETVRNLPSLNISALPLTKLLSRLPFPCARAWVTPAVLLMRAWRTGSCYTHCIKNALICLLWA